MVNQCTKFKVYRCTRYEAINGSAKCRKWSGLGRLGGSRGDGAMPPFNRAHMTSYSTLTETMHLSCTVFET